VADAYVLSVIDVIRQAGYLNPPHNTMSRNWIFDCPFTANHGGHSKQNTPSFGIHVGTGKWHCFGATCLVGGKNIDELHERLIGKLPPELEKLAEQAQKGEVLRTIEEIQVDPGFKAPTPQIPLPHPFVPMDPSNSEFNRYGQWARLYVEKRHIPLALATKAGLGWASGAYLTGSRTKGNRIVLPLQWGGKCVGYSARAMDNSEPKYFRPVNNIKSMVYDPMGIFVPGKTIPLVFVVEGEFDCLAASREGLPTVAAFGALLSEAQAAFLSARAIQTILLFDGNAAGRNGMRAAMETFGRRMNIRRLELPDDMDPGEMPLGWGQYAYLELERQRNLAADSSKKRVSIEEYRTQILFHALGN
jgi:hypothetical protein